MAYSVPHGRPLGLIVHFIRTKLADSPVYASMTEALDDKQQFASTTKSVSPLRELFQNHFKTLVISFGACVLNAVGFYTVLTYLPTYLSDTVGMAAAQSSTITTICLVLYVALVFGMGHISDMFGRKKVLIVHAWPSSCSPFRLHGAEHRTVLAGADR